MRDLDEIVDNVRPAGHRLLRGLLADLDAHDWDVMHHVFVWFDNTPAGDERGRNVTG